MITSTKNSNLQPTPQTRLHRNPRSCDRPHRQRVGFPGLFLVLGVAATVEARIGALHETLWRGVLAARARGITGRSGIDVVGARHKLVRLRRGQRSTSPRA